MQGGYFASFTYTGSLASISKFIGSHNLKGTKADVLLGTYGAGQTGSTNVFSFLDIYFPGYSNFNYFTWGWTYHYKSQTWNNLSIGTTGDIVV